MLLISQSNLTTFIILALTNTINTVVTYTTFIVLILLADHHNTITRVLGLGFIQKKTQMYLYICLQITKQTDVFVHCIYQ